VSVRDALGLLRAEAERDEPLPPAVSASLAGLLAPGTTPVSVDLPTRLRAALFALADAASRRRPLLLLLDDLEELDPLDREVVVGAAHALEGASGAATCPRLILVAAARHATGDLTGLPRIELGPLGESESQALLRSMLPGVDASAPLEELARLAAGSPLLLDESLRSWVRAGAAPRLDLGGLEYPDRVMALARARLCGVTGPARQALTLLAVAPELELRALRRLVPELDAPLTLALARSGLVTEHQRPGAVSLSLGGEHLRRVLQAELDAPRRRLLHRQIAEADDEIEALAGAAWHWEQAGETLLAAERYLRAAGSQLDFRGRLAARAAALGGPGWPSWGVAQRATARSLAAAGEAGEAVRVLETLVSAGAASEADRLQLGELLLLTEPQRALHAVDGIASPRAGLIAAQAHFLLGHHGEARQRCGELEEGSGGRENLLGLLALDGGDLALARRLFTAAEQNFGAAGDHAGLAKAANNLAIALQRLGDLRGAQQSFRHAAEEARLAGDPLRAIHAEINHGTVSQLGGEHSRALRAYDHALLEAVRLGSGQLEAQARLNLATLRLELGDSAGAAEELGRCPVSPGALGLFVLLNRADLALLRQDLGEAERQLDEAEAGAPAGDTAARVELLQLRARLGLARGEFAASSRQAGLAADLAAGAGLGRLADEARLTAMIALRRSPQASPEELRRTLEGISRRMEERGERNRLWLVWHELSQAEALLGQEIEASFHLAKARQAVQALLDDAPEELRRTLLTRPDFREVYAATRQSGSASATAGAAPAPGGLEASDAETLLRISLELGRVRDPAELVARVLDKAIEFAGAQRGLLILVEGERLRIAAARNVDQESLRRGSEQFSQTLAREVIASGRAVVTVDAAADERFRHFASVSGMRLRSVVCVPLKIWGTIAGVIYLDNRFREGAFSARQITALESLGAQAGLALDTARLLEEERRRVGELKQAQLQVEELTVELRRTIARQSQELDQAEELVRAQGRQLAGLAQFDEIVGRSPPMRRVLEQVQKTAHAEIPIYVFGESGTGKELIARAVHRLSPRSAGPMVTVNCGGLPPSLLQSELFGHVRGAFTGAVRNHPGLFRMADRGTIFLDEVTEMSPELQVQLLRVLQTGCFRPVGGEREVEVDVRVISASNVDLEQAVRRGAFREDLSYRLNVLRLDLPPLRERKDDIPLLARHFLGERRIQSAALRLLQHHDWPGNVRELANEMARASALADGEIRVEDLSPKIARAVALEAAPAGATLEEQVARFEREILREALSSGTPTEAAERLGLSRAGLYKKLARHGVAPRSARKPT